MANVVRTEKKTKNVGDEKHPRTVSRVNVVFDDGLVIYISPYEKEASWDGMTDEDAVKDAVKRASEWRRHYFDRRAGDQCRKPQPGSAVSSVINVITFYKVIKK